MRHLLFASPLYPMMLMGRTPETMRVHPPSHPSGDPETGRAILDGVFTLSHHRCDLGPEPWTSPPDTTGLVAELHGFSWVADLFAVGTDEARKKAGDLLHGWARHHGRWQQTSWRPDVLGERLVNWLSFYRFLTAEHEPAKRALHDTIMPQARHLRRSRPHAPRDGRALKAIQGLIYSAICLQEGQTFLAPSLTFLNSEIQRQIFPDGGHFERNPARLLEVLSRLGQIRSLLQAAHIEVPAFLQGAIDRMPPMLRAMRHGDGGLALFNGGLEQERSLIDKALAETGVRGKALTSAPHSGFQRLALGRTVIIMDTGKPPGANCFNAHAGGLSFEMSVGKDRLITNCGASGIEGDQWARALRSTAAHSTLSVDDLDSVEFSADGSLARGPSNVECQRREAGGSIWLEASHDGFQANAGVRHRRNLYLDASGEDFRGEDRVEGSGGTQFCLRFHLHPGVHASQAEGGTTILLKPAHGGGWRFQASGGAISLTESIYLGRRGEPRRTDQIVVSGPLNGDGAQIKWRLHKV